MNEYKESYWVVRDMVSGKYLRSSGLTNDIQNADRFASLELASERREDFYKEIETKRIKAWRVPKYLLVVLAAQRSYTVFSDGVKA